METLLILIQIRKKLGLIQIQLSNLFINKIYHENKIFIPYTDFFRL